ncbi:MAG: hypothetical protein M0026_03285 [Nocardiopsaceae bacterium]|nr:hypothetical protein [Nocardiopsaceae bacterium]
MKHVFDAVRAAEGTTMDRRSYHADAAALRQSDRIIGDVWKLERAQTFEDTCDPAWAAFLSGDWNRVLEIFDGERAGLVEQSRSYARLGLRFRRLRIVEHPPTPYLQWEMRSHRIFVECGHEIRTLEAEWIREWERDRPLPELVIYCGEVIYQVRYDERRRPVGAKRIDDPRLAAAAAATVSELYVQAEPLMDYFDREIAPLPPCTPALDW